MKARKNKRERSAQMQQVSAGLQDGSRHHPKCCVKKRLFRERHLRGYYRHRLCPETVPVISTQGECYACPQEQAYHIDP